MQALPTFLMASVVGFYLGGVQGLAIGAGCGWVLCLIAAAVGEKLSRQRAGTLAGIVQRLDAMQSTLAEISATSARGLVIQGATLDAAPVEHYDLLDMHTPRTQEDWESAYRSK